MSDAGINISENLATIQCRINNAVKSRSPVRIIFNKCLFHFLVIISISIPIVFKYFKSHFQLYIAKMPTSQI